MELQVCEASRNENCSQLAPDIISVDQVTEKDTEIKMIKKDEKSRGFGQ